VKLQASPAYTPFTPSSPGILATLPARPLHTGETFTVTLNAVNPLPQGLTGWSAPVQYNNLLVELTGVQQSGLWLQAVTSDASVVGSNTVRTVTVTARAVSQPPQAYRTSSSIPLAQLTFVVRTAVPGTYSGTIALAAGALLAPAWVAPPVAFHDYRGGTQASGSINVTTTRGLGMWAWAERGDVFNTARVTGLRVATQLYAAYVRTWGAPAAVVVSPSSCSLAGGSSGGAISLDGTACVVNVDAVNAQPAKDLAFTLGYSGSYATTLLSVWQPTRAAVEAEDPTLNSVLPLNAAPLAAGCTDSYQATRLHAWADWSNGGSAPGDTITGADITGLAAFTSNDSSVALVLGAVARGISPGTASLGLARLVPAASPAAVLVTDTPACLMALEALATTGVEFVGTPPGLLPGSVTSLKWSAVQRLDWEGVTARVVTYAQFSDGSTVDVSDRAALSLAMPSGGAAATAAPLPFALSTDAAGASLVTVNASVSGSGAVSQCGAFLAASWEVCSRPLGVGTGKLVLALPAPVAITDLAAEPAVITSATDPAALPPMSLPTSSALSLTVSFDDGSVRDFSADARTNFTVTAGATLCSTTGGGSSGWTLQVVAGSSGSLGDSCTVTAYVAFEGSATPLSASVTVAVVGLRTLLLYTQPPAAVAPPALPPAVAPLGATLRLLRCDARNFDQATLWPTAVLTNCSAQPGACPMADLSNHNWVDFNSSDSAIFDVVRGYPSDPGEFQVWHLLMNAQRAAQALHLPRLLCGFPPAPKRPELVLHHWHTQIGLAAAARPDPLDIELFVHRTSSLQQFGRLCHISAPRQPPRALCSGIRQPDSDLWQRQHRRGRQRARHLPAHVATRRQRHRHHPGDHRQHDRGLHHRVQGCAQRRPGLGGRPTQRSRH
jgi:hypothetical protein